MFVKRLGFVLLIVAVLSTLVGAPVVQSEPQQFVVVYVEFKPANARTGGAVLMPAPPAECGSPVLLIRVTPRGAWFAAGIPKLD